MRNSLMGSVFGPFSGSLSFLVFGLLASKFYFLFLLSSFTAAQSAAAAALLAEACIAFSSFSPPPSIHNYETHVSSSLIHPNLVLFYA